MTFQKAILLHLFLFAIMGLSAQSVTFLELENELIASPFDLNQKVIAANNDSFSELETSYFRAYIALKKGHHFVVDSTINYAFTNYDFTNDSLVYLRYLMVLSEQRKISKIDFKSSLKFLDKAVELARKYGDTSSFITAKISLGELFRATQNFQQGFENLDEAEVLLGIYTNKNSWQQTARLYDRRSAIFIQAKVYPDSVEKLSLKTIQLAEENGDLDLAANASNSLGYLCLEKNPPDARAEEYLINAIANWDKINFDIYATNARINLVRFYMRKERYDDGLKLLLPKLELVNESDWGWEKGGFYGSLGRLYEKKGQYKEALHYIQKSNALLTEIETAKFNDKLTSLSIEFNVKEKEEEILRKQLEIELKESALKESRTEKNFLYLTILAGTLIILISLYFVRLFRAQKKIISKANIRLNGLLHQRENLLKEVNHRLKNNLTVLSSILFLESENLENKEAQRALNSSQLRIHSISLIHESLYQQEEMEKVNFQDYLENLVKHMKEIYWQGKQDIQFDINVSDFKPNLKQSVPVGMIMNELITNSLKYAFENVAEPKVSIEFVQNSLIYYDNGPGFIPKSNASSLGLELISTFVNQLEANLSYEKVDTFTQTRITF
ncbi:MAG: two-component sensor histidine kinase [Vicingaceae bacterium]|jgi:two-component sensor histidine kinase